MTEARWEKFGDWLERKFDKSERPACPRQSLDEILREQDERWVALQKEQERTKEKQQAPVADLSAEALAKGESPPPAAVAPELDVPGFTWEDAPESPDTDLPKPLKAPPLKKGGAKPKRPPRKRGGKKPDAGG